MKTRTILFALVCLSLGLSACQRLPSKVPAGGAPLRVEAPTFTDAIPLDYGTLVGVTPHPELGDWAALWFEKPDKSIVVVWVDVVNGRFGGKMTTIPRK